MRKGALLVGSMLAASTALGAEGHHIADQWKNPALQPPRFTKFVILGIGDLKDPRHHFEDKFVLHLKARNIQGVTSYSFVPDLTAVDDKQREMILDHIKTEKIDGVISVRLVPLDKTSEPEWPARWRRWAEDGGGLRQLLEASLPVKAEKAKKYGIEVTLWETSSAKRVWSARTDIYNRSELKHGGSDLVLMVMAELIALDLV